MYNILIVEDEYLARVAVKSVIIGHLLEENVCIIEATNGLEAKDIIDKEVLDIIFMDINMPGIGGIELSKYAKKKIKDISIIITTAYDDFDIAHEAIKLKVEDYLLKPIRPQKIKDALDNILKKSDSNDKVFNKYLNDLSKYIIQYSYKECIYILKEYIELVYKDYEIEKREININRLANKVEEVCIKINIRSFKIIKSKLDELKDNNSIKINKNTAINSFINIINYIFDLLGANDDILNDYIKNIINYIERNLKNNITLVDIANHVNLSTHYLSKIFKKETGVNFITYLTDRRIELAKDMLLDENIPIINISIELCYSNPNYFSKVFKKRVGITPTEYRDKYATNKEVCLSL